MKLIAIMFKSRVDPLRNIYFLHLIPRTITLTGSATQSHKTFVGGVSIERDEGPNAGLYRHVD